MLSQLDTDRFGVRIGKALVSTATDLDELLRSAAAENLAMMIVRVNSSEAGPIHALEARKFLLMDTLVHYRTESLLGLGSMLNEKFTVRRAAVSDAERIRTLAREAFSEYSGHYHADPKLERAECTDVYADWASRSCSEKSVADVVLAAECAATGDLAGFGTLKLQSPSEFCGPLFAVSPEFRGKGVFRALLTQALSFAAKEGAHSFVYSTQITNLAAQKALCQAGFWPFRSEYTFHRWFK